MTAIKQEHNTKLPAKFEELVGLMPPQAIMDDAQHEETIQMIDRLMATRKLSKGQELYLETLVQLVGAYEATHHSVEAGDALDALKLLLSDHGINASGLAKLLGVHASMGSKILKGERSLTAGHIKLLSAKFKVRAETFLA
jgi:HTH-type transcriptional regulator / antitoxin HigA